MTCVVVPATTAHLRIMARDMRPMDRAEIEGRGYKVRHLLHYLYRATPDCRTALFDGEVAAVGGAFGGLLDDECQPWLFTTAAVERKKLAFYRETRRQIDEMLLTHRRLSTYVLADYAQATRFYASIGFNIDAPIPMGVDGLPYSLMWMERD